MFDIAWKNVWSDDNANDNAQEGLSDQKFAFVDSRADMGDNETTDEDKIRVVGE